MDRTYYVFDDPDENEVEPEEKIKAFPYGKQLVPIQQIEEDLLKLQPSKCLKLLGFTSKDKIQRNHYMTGVDMLLPINGTPNLQTPSKTLKKQNH